MLVCKFCELAIEESETVKIWSIDKEEEVYEGTYRDAVDSEFSDCEIGSFGIENGIIVINVSE